VTAWFEDFQRDGYTIIPAVLSPAEVEAARQACASALAHPSAADSLLSGEHGPPHGARNLIRLWPEIADLGRRPALLEPLLCILGAHGGIVRGLYFDKPAGAGWALPWHRDTTIAVKAHGALGRFGKPTVKAGVPHVEAPRELLATMVTARIHLDEMTDDNGPLRVIPGSHVRHADDSGEAGVTLHCLAGDVLLMRPLLLHASGHCAPGHVGSRRVVHLEFAPDPLLPDGYAWQTFIPLTSAPAPAAGSA
jgi:hypothetical protein